MIKILGIETSCDETAVAIVTSDKKILSNQIASQIAEHALYGGVVPEVASRAHMNSLDSLIDMALEEANCSLTELDAIAVTAGPGLIGGVIVGVMYAKSMAAALNKPLIAVNHLEGHALTARLNDNVEFPFLLLLVSGGHTQFLLVEGVGRYIELGVTLDDAVGEAFDKCAKMLGLGYPGGPLIEKSATGGDPFKFKFPHPLCNVANCDMSFSGLKTAVLREVQLIPNITSNFVSDVSASFQRTVSEVLEIKTKMSMKMFIEKFPEGARNFVVAGGVAANQAIRIKLLQCCEENGFKFFAPPISLCTDNAAMIAWVGVEKFYLHEFAKFDFQPRSRWELSSLI